ncbi:MAG: anaerobic ribonucleoside-triphosphate reductase [Succinivibrio sp.]
MQTRLHARNGIVGQGVKFERIRRVTGYLVGTLDRFNNGKRAEEHDRVKHMTI